MKYPRAVMGLLGGMVVSVGVVWGALALFFPTTDLDTAFECILAALAIGGVAGTLLAVGSRSRAASRSKAP